MRKSKLNAKPPVGAGLVLAQNKGITLIALIITIIVMLILVGVTINVALNGGLFTKASEAAKQTQLDADRETLQSAVLAALDSNLEIPNAKALKDNLPSGWDVTGPDGGPYTCTNTKTGNKFTVAKDGKITPDSSGGETTVGQNFPYGTYYGAGVGKVEGSLTIEQNMMKFIAPYSMDLEIQIEDEQTLSCTVTYPQENSDTEEYKYFVTENNVILQDDYDTYVKTREGLKFNLDGEYINEDESYKWVFTKGEPNAKLYRSNTYSGETYWNEQTSKTYVQLNERYFACAGEILELSSDSKSFVVDGVTYRNETAESVESSTTQIIQPENSDFVYGEYINLDKEDVGRIYI